MGRPKTQAVPVVARSLVDLAYYLQPVRRTCGLRAEGRSLVIRVRDQKSLNLVGSRLSALVLTAEKLSCFAP